MKVFISWSGPTSRAVAQALRDWLPAVIQSVEPWLSSEDIPAGTRWFSEVADALESTDVGILCLTPDNSGASWLHYEAGALSRRGALHVYALGLAPSAVSGPLSQYQVVQADQEGTWRLVRALNEAPSGPKMPEGRLERAFEVWWPQLAARLEQLSNVAVPIPPDRSAEDKIDELLDLVRGLVRSASNVAAESAPVTKAAELKDQSPNSKRRPRVFIGSSTEGLPVAEAIQENLDATAETTVWNQNAFGQSRTFIESLVDLTAAHDFAVIVLTPDDLVTKRGDTKAAPRDNLLFELGLFTGALGRARTFLVYPREVTMHLPTDLLGVTAVTYSERSDGNLTAAVGPLSTRIKRAMGTAEK